MQDMTQQECQEAGAHREGTESQMEMEEDFLESQREAQAGPCVSDRAAREALGMKAASLSSVAESAATPVDESVAASRVKAPPPGIGPSPGASPTTKAPPPSLNVPRVPAIGGATVGAMPAMPTRKVPQDTASTPQAPGKHDSGHAAAAPPTSADTLAPLGAPASAMPMAAVTSPQPAVATDMETQLPLPPRFAEPGDGTVDQWSLALAAELSNLSTREENCPSCRPVTPGGFQSGAAPTGLPSASSTSGGVPTGNLPAPLLGPTAADPLLVEVDPWQLTADGQAKFDAQTQSHAGPAATAEAESRARSCLRKEADPSKEERYYGNHYAVIPYAWENSDGWQPPLLPPPLGRVKGNLLAATSAASADPSKEDGVWL